jgi:hypothetical protein
MVVLETPHNSESLYGDTAKILGDDFGKTKRDFSPNSGNCVRLTDKNQYGKCDRIFKHNPREEKVSPETLETLGPRDFIDESPESEPAFYEIIFQSSDVKDETVRCKELFPRPSSETQIKIGRVDKKIILINMGENLDSTERVKILQLCAKYVDICARPPGPWKVSKMRPHEIDTGDSLPVRQ